MTSTTGPHLLTELLEGLPDEPSELALLPALIEQLQAAGTEVVVIDDDPTGTQTVYDAHVLLGWDER